MKRYLTIQQDYQNISMGDYRVTTHRDNRDFTIEGKRAILKYYKVSEERAQVFLNAIKNPLIELDGGAIIISGFSE